MSQPLPGPMRPLTDNPKVNVLNWYGLGAMVAAISVATMASGAWRLVAILPGLLCVALLVSAVRAGVAAAKDTDDPSVT